MKTRASCESSLHQTWASSENVDKHSLLCQIGLLRVSHCCTCFCTTSTLYYSTSLWSLSLVVCVSYTMYLLFQHCVLLIAFAYSAKTIQGIVRLLLLYLLTRHHFTIFPSQVLHLYRKYFSSMASIAMATMHILNGRVFPVTAPGYEVSLGGQKEV